MAKANHNSILLAEALAATIIAIGIEAANYLAFKNSELGVALAIQTGFIGLLLSLQRRNLENETAAQLAPVQQLAAYVDVQNDADYEGLRALIQRYSSIGEPEFRPVKEQIVAGATERIRTLAINKRSSTLHTTDYYDWLFKQFARTQKGEYIHAVSLSSDEGWNDSQLEINFQNVNLAAAKRGVEITRIFILSDARLEAFLELPPIRAHASGAQKGLVGLRVSLEELERYDNRILESVGQGFLDFNGHVGLEDRFDAHGQARGEVTMLPDDLARMKSIYERLLNMTRPLVDQ